MDANNKTLFVEEIDNLTLALNEHVSQSTLDTKLGVVQSILALSTKIEQNKKANIHGEEKTNILDAMSKLIDSSDKVEKRSMIDILVSDKIQQLFSVMERTKKTI